MPRIVGVNIPDEKQIWISLTYIYGIGQSSSRKILKEAGVKEQKKAKELSQNELDKIKNAIERKYKTEGDLRREIMINIKRLKDVGSYRGTRHQKKLPVRGQRTRCNSRTVRGNVKRTVGSGRSRAPAPK